MSYALPLEGEGGRPAHLVRYGQARMLQREEGDVRRRRLAVIARGIGSIGVHGHAIGQGQQGARRQIAVGVDDGRRWLGLFGMDHVVKGFAHRIGDVFQGVARRADRIVDGVGRRRGHALTARIKLQTQSGAHGVIIDELRQRLDILALA